MARAHALIVLLLLGSASGDRPEMTNQLRLEINIPAARLDAWLGSRRILSFPVATGSATYPTPVGDFEISEIIWNPWWIPPESDWARGETPKPPGAANPMGRVKLAFAPLYYIHGSPDTMSIGYPRSHGCVRMRNPDVMTLAAALESYAAPADLPVSLGSDPDATRAVTLPEAVPLRIIYERVEANDSLVTLHPDPYSVGAPTLQHAKSIIESAGPGTVHVPRLRAFLNLPSSRRFVVARAFLLGESEAYHAFPE